MLPLGWLLIAWSAFPQLSEAEPSCQPIFVRWPRVRLGVPPKLRGAYSLRACRTGCAQDEDPNRAGADEPCAAFNHRVGPSDYHNECHIFDAATIRQTDGLIEADDRFSFFWKYCIQTNRSCSGDYGFTFLSDRFISPEYVSQVKTVASLEECLADCLNRGDFHCRSVAYNRTNHACHISPHNQLSKPFMIKINNNPNFRIDYYENNCFNTSDTFSFGYACEEDGIRVRVHSKFPYTGALYGLYDFFTCRVEPREERDFDLLFPYPTVSRNCSDSIRYKGDEMVLEVVLSTDGVEPLYFITADDLTYQARCPIAGRKGRKTTPVPLSNANNSVQQVLNALTEAEKNGSFSARSQRVRLNGLRTSFPTGLQAFEPEPLLPTATTKDVFPLPLLTPTSTTIPGLSRFEVEVKKPRVSSTTTSTASITSTTTTSSGSSAQIESENGINEAKKTVVVGKVSHEEGSEDYNSEVSPPRTTTEQDKGEPQNKVEETTPVQETTSTKPDSSDHHDEDEDLTPPSNYYDTIESSTKSSDTTTTVGHRGMEPIVDQHDQKSAEGVDDRTTINSLVERDPSNKQNFSFSTHISFPTANKIALSTSHADARKVSDQATTTTEPKKKQKLVPASTTTTTTLSPVTTPTTTVAATTSTTTPSTTTTATKPKAKDSEPSPPGTQETKSQSEPGPPGSQKPNGEEAVAFDIYHNGKPTDAVVVSSPITLTFTPFYAIPPAYMSLSGCQVEPIDSLYEWEREPLAIIKDGCPADHLGLVCPPAHTDFGVRVSMEPFRYQTTAQMQYTCLVRVCPFAPCPQATCSAIDGCPQEDLLSRSLGLRHKRHLSLEQIRAALAANPLLQQQLALSSPSSQINSTLHQQLLTIGGDHIVRKKLVVLNSEEDLEYYVKTGDLPEHHGK